MMEGGGCYCEINVTLDLLELVPANTCNAWHKASTLRAHSCCPINPAVSGGRDGALLTRSVQSIDVTYSAIPSGWGQLLHCLPHSLWLLFAAIDGRGCVQPGLGTAPWALISTFLGPVSGDLCVSVRG